MAKLQEETTIIIKTFARQDCLVRLLKSIAQYYPDLKILIADDSKAPYKQAILDQFDHLDIDYYILPFDTGLSAGRNYLLQRVETPYFLLSDDDMVFDKHTDIERALRCLKENSYDILGGTFYNRLPITRPADIITLVKHYIANTIAYKHYTKRATLRPKPSYYAGYFELKDKVLTMNFYKEIKVAHCRVDIVNNFFIANTASIANIGGWEAQQKISDHFGFFLKCKNHGVRVGFLNDFGALHMRPRCSAFYRRYRINRCPEYEALAFKRHGLDGIKKNLDVPFIEDANK